MGVIPSIYKSNDTSKSQLVNMIDLARPLQSTYVLGLLAGAGASFAISLLFLALLKREFKMPANNAPFFESQDLLRKAVLSTIWTSVTFTLACVIASDKMTNAMAFMSHVDLSVTRVRVVAEKALSIL